MKNTKLLLFAILLFTGTAFSSFAQDIRAGIRGGLNISNLQGGGASPDNTFRPGLHLGAYGELPVKEEIGFIVELLFSQEGTITRGGGPYHYVRMNYIKIPAMISYSFSPALKGIAGFSFSVPVYARHKEDRGGSERNFINEIHQQVLSLPLGVIYELESGLNLGARFDLGLTPVGDDGARSHLLMLSVGYTIKN